MNPLPILKHISADADNLDEGTHERSQVIDGYDVTWTVFIQQIQPPFYGDMNHPPHAGEYKTLLESIECHDEQMTELLTKYIGEI